MIAVNGKMTNLSINLTGWSLSLGTLSLCWRKLILLILIWWVWGVLIWRRIGTSTTSITFTSISISSSSFAIITSIIKWFIFCTKQGSEFIKTQLCTPCTYGRSKSIVVFWKTFGCYVKQFLIIKNYSNCHQLVPYNLDFLQVYIYKICTFFDTMDFSLEVHDVWPWNWGETILKNLPHLCC